MSDPLVPGKDNSDFVEGVSFPRAPKQPRKSPLAASAFSSLSEARAVLAAWRDDYNRVRPHSALANRTPEEFRQRYMALAETNSTGQNFTPGFSL